MLHVWRIPIKCPVSQSQSALIMQRRGIGKSQFFASFFNFFLVHNNQLYILSADLIGALTGGGPTDNINNLRGGDWAVKKPSRSDEVMEADRQLRIAEEVRAHFDNMAPKRPMKPNRSESDSTTETPLQGSCFENGTIPELSKLQSLRSQSEPFFKDGAFLVQDEFVETQYYKELNSIDKQHHMTGSGFIRVASEGSGEVYGVQSEGMSDGGARDMGLMVFRSNPATNDWIPSLEGEQALFTSSKPNRSESC